MVEFFNKKNEQIINPLKIVSLLIHAAKIDENYTEKEKKLIKNFLTIFLKENQKIISEDEITDLTKKAEKYENDSNQILEFTKEVKKVDLKLKKLVIKTLWEIVLSDGEIHDYESSLLRRLAGLLYISDVNSGNARKRALDKLKN